MTANEVVARRLLEAVPELRDPYDQEVRDWTDEGLSPFLTFDLVVTPWLDEQIKPPANLDAVRRLFEVLESAITDPSAEVRSMVRESTVEFIALTPSVLEATLPLMGPETRRVVIEIRDWRLPSLPWERWWQALKAAFVSRARRRGPRR